jgi:hypothetical protein
MIRRGGKQSPKDPNVYPPGWDRQRVARIIRYYDARKDQDVLAGNRARRTVAQHVWMEIPRDLVPAVRNLIASRRKSA